MKIDRLNSGQPSTVASPWSSEKGPIGSSANVLTVSTSSSMSGPLSAPLDVQADRDLPITLRLRTSTLFDNWQESQKNENIRERSLKYHMDKIRSGEPLEPICIEKVFVTKEDAIRLRTADGRHRLTAAMRFRVPEIEVVDSEVARQVKDIFCD
ncbi:hypothetical protein [Trinickia mobilis]|uniref:hypothetical protein n=1 Tax=Trinickia mobilis TaxID=2816356 RepID=UPI001A8C5383|nr:hypothetical protein [Trinickia mobilis]